MNRITAMARMLASRCFRNIMPTRPRTLGPPFRPSGAVPKVSGLRSAVSLASLIFNPATSPDACLDVIPRRRGDSPWLAGQVNRHAPANCYLQRATTDQTAIAPVCLTYTWFFVEPSYRVGVAVYGSTLPLTTNFRPVSVVGGDTRPPESWKR